jgi:chromosome partitioning protein
MSFQEVWKRITENPLDVLFGAEGVTLVMGFILGGIAAGKFMHAWAQSLALRETNQLRQENGGLKAQLDNRTSEVQAAKKVLGSLKKRIRHLNCLTKVRKAVWQSPATQPPPFLALAERKTPVLAVFNLKGGVGKSTVTYHLARHFAQQNLRVLCIDLDHQGSLTQMLLDKESDEVRRGAQNVENWLTSDERTFFHLLKRVTENVDGIGVIPAGEQLHEVENKLFLDFMLRKEVRYLLREALHDGCLKSKYDLVLIDCPPRINATSINALFASDYVLVPTLPEKLSVTAISRLCEWLEKMKKVCPEINVLGVVGNRFQRVANNFLVANREQWGIVKALKFNAQPVHCFDTILPLSQGFSTATPNSADVATIASLADEITDLVPIRRC